MAGAMPCSTRFPTALIGSGATGQWKRAGGDTGDLMLLLGWTSEEMPRRYRASAAAERAQETHQRIGVGDHA